MSVQSLSLEEIRRAGLDALGRALGPVGMVRFLQQYETGQGDYSVERHQWLGEASVKELAERVQQRRPASS